ncbi:hypothetical protein CEXT_415371 [Caerostris extrusa]|uniref:Uncharacterized protein n=1 Tax=Caerostris extrusa TaxID=172846 RepID=A0AAV4U3S3_CAEEX|nr:hypothetical protein CEXT_415371 [Caerostris extrusa]
MDADRLSPNYRLHSLLFSTPHLRSWVGRILHPPTFFLDICRGEIGRMVRLAIVRIWNLSSEDKMALNKNGCSNGKSSWEILMSCYKKR